MLRAFGAASLGRASAPGNAAPAGPGAGADSPTSSSESALEIRQKSGNPLALVADGRLIGVIGDDEIYRGILRQTGIAEGTPPERDPLAEA